MFPLSVLQLQERLNNPEIANAVTNNLTIEFKDEIKARLEKQSNIILDIWGMQGSGKSYSALSISSFFPKFYVFWDRNDVIQNLKTVEPPCVILLDEVTETWGLGSFRTSVEYQTMLETLRKRQISFIHCSPMSKFLHLCHYGLETLYVDVKKEETFCLLYNREGAPLGYVKIPHPKRFLPADVVFNYEKNKDEFLDRVLHVKNADNITNKAKEFLKSEQWKNDLKTWKNKNKDKEVAGWFLEQSICAFYPELKRNVETLELVNCVKYLLLGDGENDKR